jgi:predicted MFS family arabinose efflux permease
MIPSWQAFVPSLVPKADLASAITLNSTQFNASRAIGPAVAGLLLAAAGPGWAFLLNGISFLTVLAALWVIRPLPVTNPRPAAPRARVTSEFRAALRYINQRNGLRLGILSALLIAFFGNPVTQFTVVFADQVYHSGPTVLGLLAAAMGIGAVLAAPLLSIWDATVARSTVVRWGLPAYAVCIVGFGLAPNWPLGLLALLLTGGGFLAVIATTNTAMQVIVADHMRGRVLSARVMGFTLAYPLGSLAQGALADLWGPQVTVVSAGSCLLAVSLFLATKPTLLADLNREDDTPDRHGAR